MRVVMFVYNRCTTDARVLKTAGHVTRAGHEVVVVAVLDRTTTPVEHRDGFRIVRIDRDPVHYRILRWTRRARRLVRGRWIMRRLRWYRRRMSDVTPRAVVGLALLPVAVARMVVAGVAGVRARIAGRDAAGDQLAEGSDGSLKRVDRMLSTALRAALMRLHKPLMFYDYYRRALQAVERGGGADIYHANDLITLPVAWLAARRTHGRLVYDAHELYPEVSTLSRRERWIWNRIEVALIGRTDAVVTVCDSIADELVRRHGVARPTVVLNTPPRRVSVTGEVSPLRSSLGGDERPIVLYQGGFAPHRGLETLVRAARELPGCSVVLMGWGGLEDRLRALIADEDLEERVTIVPPVPAAAVTSYAAGATLGVIPYEPVGLNNRFTTPNKLFDYMSAGLPIVASRLPELVRYIESAGIGRLFEPGDAASLAVAARWMMADPARLTAMSARATELSRQYTWETEGDRLLRIYDGLGRERMVGSPTR